LKLLYSPTSPYARKVVAVSIVTGLYDKIERIETSPHPIERDVSVLAHNPLAKVPTLITSEGLALFDSRVISEYLDANSLAGRVFPVQPVSRWKALALQSVGDGILDAALLVRYERTARPEALRWPLWQERQFDKIISALDALEQDRELAGSAVHIGTITLAAALEYLDLRFAEFAWRSGRPRLETWLATFAQHEFLLRTAAPAPKAA
jgi:glutathione S-transferase